MTTTEYELAFLGEPQIRDRQTGPIQVSAKQLALIARVSVGREPRVSRGELSKLLWPRSSESSARHSLSQALYMVNREIPDLLTADPESISANECHCDVHEFRSRVERSDWVGASSLYRGPFLQGLVLDSPAFSHWVDGLRAELSLLAERTARGLYVTLQWAALEQLTSKLVAQGRPNEFVLSARLAALYQTAGPASAADFINGLPEDLAPGIRSELESLGPSTVDLGGSPQVFVGRSEQMQELVDLYDRALDGAPAIALIAGEPGIGKTALANRYYRLLAMRGAQVLMASAHAAEHNVPLGIVEQWLRDVSPKALARIGDQPWMAVLRHVFPGIERKSMASGQVHVGAIGYHRLLESIRRLLVDLAETKPLVLAVDDLHHADAASISLIHYLYRRDPVGPSMVVATTRTEGSGDLSRLDDWEDVHKVFITGLAPREIETWLDRVQVGAWADLSQVAEVLFQRTGGNPLLISAMLEEGAVGSSPENAPQSVIDFYRPRITGRSNEARRLLAAISLVGEALSWRELAEIADLTTQECLNAGRELEGLNWIDVRGEKLVLRHSLLGQAAISLLSTVERKALHGKAARVLSAGGVSPHALVAVSHDLAGNQADAFDAAMRAVKACETLHARSEKEFFLKLGLSNAPTSSDAGEVRVQLAQHLLDERRSPEALDAIDPTFFIGLSQDLVMRAELVRIKIEAEMATQLEDLATLWKRAEVLREELGSLALADTYSLLAGISHDLGFDQKSLEIAEQIAQHLSALPLTLESAHKLLRPIVIIGMSRGVEGALRRFDMLPRPSASEGDPHYACAYHGRRASLLVAAGHLLEAEENFAQAFEYAERYALFDHHFFIHNNLGVCLMEQGRYTEAEEHLKAAGDFVDPKIAPGHHWIVEDNLMLLEFERGAHAKALEMAETSKTERVGSSVRAGMSLHCIIGLCSLEQGGLARSKEAEREIKFMAESHDPTGNDMSYINVFLARMLHVRDETARALDLLAEAAEWYETRNVLAFARIRLEQCRLGHRTGVDFAQDLIELRRVLEGSGAVPLISSVESLMTRV